jgi:hypothetical protein
MMRVGSHTKAYTNLDVGRFQVNGSVCELQSIFKSRLLVIGDGDVGEGVHRVRLHFQ